MKILSLAVLAHSFFNFRPLRACGDVGRMVQAASTVAVAGLNNAANAAMNSQTNRTNRAIAEETNAMAYQIHQDDMNFNAEQAQIQREWDAPAAQRQRLIDAGYNPLMLGNGAFGSSGSAASAPAAPSLDSATLNPNMLDFRPAEIAEAIGAAIGNRKQKAEERKTENEADAIELDNKMRIFNIEKMPERFMNELEVHSWAKTEHDKKIVLFGLDEELKKSETAYNLALKLMQDKYNELADIKIKEENENLSFLTSLHEKQLVKADEDIKAVRAQRSLFYAQAKDAVSRAHLNDVTAEGVEIDNQSREERNKLEIQSTALQIERDKILSLDIIQRMDCTAEEKSAIADFLANHDNITASELVACCRDVTSMAEKELKRKYKIEAINFAKQIAVGVLAAGAVIATGGTAGAAMAAGAAPSVLGRMFGSSPAAPAASAPAATSSVGLPMN